MRIALIGLRLTVGPRLIVDTLVPALERQGHDVAFVGQARELSVPVRTLCTNRDASYPAMVGQALSRRFRDEVVAALVREQPDCCYFIAVHPANGPLCHAIRRSVRTGTGARPLLAVHLHDPWPHPGWSWPLVYGAQQLMARAADRVVVYGQALTAQVTRHYGVPADRIIVIRHGASRPPRTEPPRESGSWTQFSFLGRIAGYKGLDLFLAAARRLRASRPDLRFLVGGAGSLTPYRRALADLGDAVTVLERELSNEETDRIMQSSWAVVLPYTSATQSGVIAVACWNGCPVITTTVGALAESVWDGETGFLVPPRDAAALADSMAVLCDPEARRRMGRAAFLRYDRHFRWDTIAGQLTAGFAAPG